MSAFVYVEHVNEIKRREKNKYVCLWVRKYLCVCVCVKVLQCERERPRESEAKKNPGGGIDI